MFGSFGNTQSTNPNSNATTGGGNLFGGTNSRQQGGGMFGSFSTAQNQPQGQTSLFGNAQQPLPGQNTNQTQNQGTTGSLFGGQQQQPTSNLFGTSMATNQPQQQTGGLFGNAPTQQQPSTGSLFGSAPSTSTSGGGLFGNKPAGSLFGTQPTGLSINTGATNATTSNNNPLFGNTLSQTQQPQQVGQNQPSTSNFFTPPFDQQAQKNPLFGSALGQSANTPNPLFGGSSLGTSTLGQQSGLGGLGQSTLSASSLLSRNQSLAPSQTQGDSTQAQFLNLSQKIEAIADAWNSASPGCQFQHYFYNLVDPSHVSQYGRPPNATNEALWQKAVRENPDSNCLVPVLAVGFDDLRQRVEAQSKKASEQQEQLKELKSRLTALMQRHTVSNSSRLQRASSMQAQLTHRLLTFIQHLHLLMPALRSSAIRPEEEGLRGQLEEIEEELRRGRGKGKINELWALVGAFNAAKGRIPSGSGNGGEWVVVDEEGLAQVIRVLSEQQAGLAHLTKILQRALKDLGIIMGKGGSSADEVYDVDKDELWNSTSTLRASALR